MPVAGAQRQAEPAARAGTGERGGSSSGAGGGQLGGDASGSGSQGGHSSCQHDHRPGKLLLAGSWDEAALCSGIWDSGAHRGLADLVASC
jgi:hypothetical protein